MEGRVDSTNASPKSIWNLQDDILSTIKRIANKFAVLQEEEVNESGKDLKNEWMEIIDKDKAYEVNRKEMNIEEEIELDENDVYIDRSTNAKFMLESRGSPMSLDAEHLTNNVLHSGSAQIQYKDMKDFQECINEMEMEDLYSHEIQFTWTKSLRNPNATILICPGIVKKPHKAFRLANYVTEKEEFGDILKSLKTQLNKLNWNNGNLFNRVEELKGKLSRIQAKIHKDPLNKELREEEVKVLDECITADDDEEKLLCQKAKVDWLRDRDRNSSYFHKVLKGKLNRSKIHKVMGNDGSIYENEQVGIQFVKHFESFLRTTSTAANMEESDSSLFNKIDTNDAECMCKEVTEVEIKRGVFDIDDSKAPGPDGFTLKFFKKVKEIIKDDFCNAIKEFSRTRKILGEVNATLITLVPKVYTLLKATDFRPIACCNVVALTDNILLTQELLKGYNNNNGPKRCSLKIDIQKAYDTLSWSFLEKVLHNYGFHKAMIQWIMVCITSPKFTIYVNGERVGHFKSGRGLRQGDPISPYLFTLVMEVLNIFLKDEIAKERNFKYHFGCKKLKITHLCFVDNLLMLCHGDASSILTIKRALEKFSKVSGLHPNMSKSTMFYGSLSGDKKYSILNILPFKIGKLVVRYLGVPLMDKKIGVKDCKSLIDKVGQKAE
ncbi:RNA-directed DNA polymerase, eukaryota, reverse transcriptase zinc-binding domain protein [Tanacetum coccineum]|uniref:RNA-directed DNA polymerase, eukaryota, reverse transcriptase zinc-binding domain protein n=1 Tax=Tanacetum coccineum TaxID=301880 RepID=A0ABQ5EK30_9ASTR